MEKIKILEELCTQRPNDSKLLFLLATAYYENQEYLKAVKTLDLVQQLNDENILPALDDLRVKILIEESFGKESKAEKLKLNEPIIKESIKIEEEIQQRQKNKVTFNDVGGLEKVKQAINMKIIQPLLNPELFRSFGQKIGGGILLYGPPGCGKTYIAKATAGECSAHFNNIQITDIISHWQGESSQNMSRVFVEARMRRPSIVFIDEIDLLGMKRGKIDSEGQRSAINQLLVEMEGVDSDNEGVLVIGSSNMPWDIDSALKRPGRFDKAIFVEPPDKIARKKIFELKLKQRPHGIINYDELVEITDFFSGADIMGVIDVASESVLHDIISGKSDVREITQQKTIEAIKSTRPSTKEWLKTMVDYVRYANQFGLYDDVANYLEKYKGFI